MLWIQSMPRMPYVYLWMPIGRNGLGMCLPFGRVYFKTMGVKKDSVPDMIKVKLTYIPIKSWVVHNPTLIRNIGK